MLKDLGDSTGDQNQQLLDQIHHANEVIRQKESEIERLSMEMTQVKEDAARREKESDEEITSLRNQLNASSSEMQDELDRLNS